MEIYAAYLGQSTGTRRGKHMRTLCVWVLALLSCQGFVGAIITFNASYPYPTAVKNLKLGAMVFRFDQHPMVIGEFTFDDWPSNISSRLVSMVLIDGQLQVAGEIMWGHQCYGYVQLVDVGKQGLLHSCNLYFSENYILSLISVSDKGM